MKTILFCAATLLFSGIAIGQQAGVKSQQSSSAAGSVSQKPGNIQGAGAIDFSSATEVRADAEPAVATSKKAVAGAKSEVNKKSQTALDVTASQAENAQEFSASQMVKTKADLEATPRTTEVKINKPGAATDVSVHTNNKTSAAASINGAQNTSTPVRAIKQKKVRASTGTNVSANSNIRPSNIHAAGQIRTSAGLGL